MITGRKVDFHKILVSTLQIASTCNVMSPMVKAIIISDLSRGYDNQLPHMKKIKASKFQNRAKKEVHTGVFTDAQYKSALIPVPLCFCLFFYKIS